MNYLPKGLTAQEPALPAGVVVSDEPAMCMTRLESEGKAPLLITDEVLCQIGYLKNPLAHLWIDFQWRINEADPKQEWQVIIRGGVPAFQKGSIVVEIGSPRASLVELVE